MSNINIFDLPTLSVDNFYPDSDFVIVQRPGGGTYKILASEALSVSRNVKDRKRGARDIIDERNIRQTSQNKSDVIIFDYENLLEKDTAWNIQIVLKVNGNLEGFDPNQNYPGKSYKRFTNIPSKGDQRFMNISKLRNSNLINSRYLVGQTSTLFEKFEFNYQQYKKISGAGKNANYGYVKRYIIYSIIVDTQEQNKIKLHFERDALTIGPAADVGYSITLTAQI